MTFPKSFLWGAATSAHQVDGGSDNDWSVWEKKNAPRLAATAKERYGRLAIWPEISQEAQNPANYISANASGHWERFEEDFACAASLGLNAYRFSLEWSRIEPEEGVFDENAIAHYRTMLACLRGHNIEPFVTLWHWPVPLWLKDKGGWQSNQAVDYFTRYATRVTKSLGEQVKFWITINEPEIYAKNGYLSGRWPPGKKSVFSFLRAIRNLVSAHIEAYTAIKTISPKAQVGMAKNNIYFEAVGNNPWNKLLKKCADYVWNDWFLNRIRNYQDFVGINHYFHNRINGTFSTNENKKVSDLGWELYPESLYHVVVDTKKYGLPIYVTEHGLADMKDSQRAWFVTESLQWLAKAIEDGIDVRGYLHWSLLDNFEWAEGFWPRFGLIEIDYKTLKRKTRASARMYADIICPPQS